MLFAKPGPCLDTCVANIAGNQFVSKPRGGFRSSLPIARADCVALLVSKYGQVDARWNGAFRVFHRHPDIDQWYGLQQNL